MNHLHFFKLDNQFQKGYSGYLTLFLNGCVRKKNLFFLIKLFHHLLKMYFGSKLGDIILHAVVPPQTIGV